MDDGRTEPFEPYQPETSYDWDYEEQPPRGPAPKILWGRIALLAAVFLVAFLIGRATGGGGGVSQESYDSLKRQNNSLEQELAAAKEELKNPPDQNASPAATATAAATEAPEGDSVTYIVKPGDTLSGIADKYYDDPSLADFIAEANGIDPGGLRPGIELTIPPKP